MYIYIYAVTGRFTGIISCLIVVFEGTLVTDDPTRAKWKIVTFLERTERSEFRTVRYIRYV